MRSLFIALCALMLSACGSSEKNEAVEAIKFRLKDPDSATFDKVKVVTSEDGKKHVCGRYNAKNSMGGYSGYSRFIYDVAEKSIIEIPLSPASSMNATDSMTVSLNWLYSCEEMSEKQMQEIFADTKKYSKELDYLNIQISGINHKYQNNLISKDEWDKEINHYKDKLKEIDVYYEDVLKKTDISKM